MEMKAGTGLALIPCRFPGRAGHSSVGPSQMSMAFFKSASKGPSFGRSFIDQRPTIQRSFMVKSSLLAPKFWSLVERRTDCLTGRQNNGY